MSNIWSPVSFCNSRGKVQVVLIRAHASRHVADEFDNSDPSQGAVESHIAWDTGAPGIVPHFRERPA